MVRNALLLFILIILPGCSRNTMNMEYVESVARMENPVYRDKPVPESIIDELNPLIEDYHKRIAEYADSAEKLQLLYKNIAQRYMDIGFYEQAIETYIKQIEENEASMQEDDERLYDNSIAMILMQKKIYSKAYEYLQKSLRLSPSNELILYYSGFCAAYIGKALKVEDYSEGNEWLEKAIKYYRLAIEIDPDYREALYGLSIILVYEMGRPGESIEPLLRIKEKNKLDIDALFVLATAYYQTGNYEASMKEYQNIESITKSAEKKEAARKNREKIMDMHINPQ